MSYENEIQLYPHNQEAYSALRTMLLTSLRASSRRTCNSLPTQKDIPYLDVIWNRGKEADEAS